MNTRRVQNRRKTSAKTPDARDEKVRDVPEKSSDSAVNAVPLSMKLSISEQIGYHWLFAIEFEEPIHHAILPFSEPIAQEMNN